MEDITLALYVADSVKEEPFIISTWFGSPASSPPYNPFGKDCAEHAWWDAQLQEIQFRFQILQFHRGFEEPLDGEQAGGSVMYRFRQSRGWVL